jgi:D-amino-acid dehydrogenase
MVGISTAIWLQRAGFKVTIIDQIGPAGGASYGNAGVLAAGSVIPITTPALPKNAFGMLLNKASPLFIRWPYLPKMIPFLASYLKHCTTQHVEYYARSMIPLLRDTVAQHQALFRSIPKAFFGSAGVVIGMTDPAARTPALP